MEAEKNLSEVAGTLNRKGAVPIFTQDLERRKRVVPPAKGRENTIILHPVSFNSRFVDTPGDPEKKEGEGWIGRRCSREKTRVWCEEGKEKNRRVASVLKVEKSQVREGVRSLLTVETQ